MILDIKNKCLQFYQDGSDIGIAFDNINMELTYRLALSFAAKGDKIQIVDFSLTNSK